MNLVSQLTFVRQSKRDKEGTSNRSTRYYYDENGRKHKFQLNITFKQFQKYVNLARSNPTQLMVEVSKDEYRYKRREILRNLANKAAERSVVLSDESDSEQLLRSTSAVVEDDNNDNAVANRRCEAPNNDKASTQIKFQNAEDSQPNTRPVEKEFRTTLVEIASRIKSPVKIEATQEPREIITENILVSDVEKRQTSIESSEVDKNVVLQPFHHKASLNCNTFTADKHKSMKEYCSKYYLRRHLDPIENAAEATTFAASDPPKKEALPTLRLVATSTQPRPIAQVTHKSKKKFSRFVVNKKLKRTDHLHHFGRLKIPRRLEPSPDPPAPPEIKRYIYCNHPSANPVKVYISYEENSTSMTNALLREAEFDVKWKRGQRQR